MLQRETFDYFLKEVNPANGLIIDKTATDWPASIAATGLALACYPVGVERGFMTRDAAVARNLTTLRFFGPAPTDPGQTPPATQDSTMISRICRLPDAPGNANFRRSIAPSSWLQS